MVIFNIVLNLIINGLPSIQNDINILISFFSFSFKPYYKWITFNTKINEYSPKFWNWF